MFFNGCKLGDLGDEKGVEGVDLERGEAEKDRNEKDFWSQGLSAGYQAEGRKWENIYHKVVYFKIEKLKF